MWEEAGKYPDLIIELLSSSTVNVDEVIAALGGSLRENDDRTLKKELYQNQFRTPEYFWFSPDDLEFAGFRLVGNLYQEITPDSRSWLWSEVLGLYLGVAAGKLRYFTPSGVLVPSPEEAAEQERQQKEISQRQLEQERIKSERLAERLRSLGVDPDSLD